MLSVAIHKDISEYQPKLIGKMTTRTLGCIAGAIGAAVVSALYIYFVLGLNVGDFSWVIWAVSIPFWCVGFFKPCGMPFEQFAPLWLKAYFTNDRIFYTPSMKLANLITNKPANFKNKKEKSKYDKIYNKQCDLRGIECYSPRAGRVVI